MHWGPPVFLLAAIVAIPGQAAELPITETPVARLALDVVPDSLEVSPDSSRVAMAAKAGPLTLEDRGIFINSTPENPGESSPQTEREQIRMYIDDKSGAAFDLLTPAVFSPDSRHIGFAGLREKHWHIIVDNKTLAEDGDDAGSIPIAFSPDSQTVAWSIKRGDQFFITVGPDAWPALDADSVGNPVFSPDGKHVAIGARRRAAWMVYVDGRALRLPEQPPPASGAKAQDSAARLDRFTQISWRPDSAALGYFAAYLRRGWQGFVQTLDGKFIYASAPMDSLLNEPMAFSEDSRQFALAGELHNRWSVLPVQNPPAGALEQVLLGTLAFVDAGRPASAEVTGAPGAGEELITIGRAGDRWRILKNGAPAGDTYDSVVENTFTVSPDRRHFAFAASRDHRTLIVEDGGVIATCDEAAGSTFSFSPDSKHLAYAARRGGAWSACVDGGAGAAFAAIGATPIEFSPDSSRIAYDASTGAKAWHLVVGLNADEISKPLEAFLKGSRVEWLPDGRVETIAIEKKVAMRVEAKP